MNHLVYVMSASICTVHFQITKMANWCFKEFNLKLKHQNLKENNIRPNLIIICINTIYLQFFLYKNKGHLEGINSHV